MSIVTFGPSGGAGGQEFTEYTIPMGATLNEIHVFTDRYIDALQIVYTDATGQTVTLPKVGGLGGEQHVFTLEADEYLTGISGHTDWYLDSIRFHTNKRTSEMYGGESGMVEFRFEAPPESEVIGFFGRTDWYVDAIGIVTRERVTEAEAAPAEAAEQESAAAPAATTVPAAPPKMVPAPASTTGEPKPKELQKVEGIGPKISNLLVENGIPDLHALAQADPAQIKEILMGAGRRYAAADPTTWPEQAALGAKGDWDGLKQLQEELKGGRRV